MIHYDNVLELTKKNIEEIWKQEKHIKAYIVQNVYGKITVYFDTQDKNFVMLFEAKLREAIGNWLAGCEMLSENCFAETQMRKWEKGHKPVSERIWVIEKFLTNIYWDSEQEKQGKCKLNSRLISFYSFKGGVGRTTTMVLSAIELAKRGKKVVMIDMDLEAPGVSSLFPGEEISKYGVLDFLIESQVYGNEVNIDEYLYTVSEYCHVSQEGGELYVVPALGQVCRNDVELYRKNLMRFDLNIPEYREAVTPIDVLLTKVDSFLTPDYILIDTRSGLHQIGGITLSRYSDMAVLFFYGSQQNAEGMKMVFPVLKHYEIPFTLVNCKIPANENVAQVEKKIYLEGSYNAMALCDDQYREGLTLIDDESGDHYPLDIPYSEALEVIGSTDQLLRVYEEQKASYRQLVNVLEDSLEEEEQEEATAESSGNNERDIVAAFSEIMNGLETGAAEDEFATEKSLSEKFYPLKGYAFIFDTRKFLVLGQKGIGKTALFSALKNNQYAKSLAKYLKVNSEQYEHTEWLVGTSQDTNWVFAFGCLETEEQVSAFLYYKIIVSLLENNPSLKKLLDDSILVSLFGQKKEESEFYHSFTKDTAFRLEQFFFKINEYLKKENRIVTIIYDALDRVVAAKDRAKFNSALIDLWYRHESTVQNIRSKIFLREDIYNREVEVADKVKLKNYSVKLNWDYDQLFAMVWKRAICKSDIVKEFYERKTAQTVPLIKGLSYVPIIDEQVNRDMLTALIGSRMGSGNKAATYNWFRNRLSDTNDIIVPRSILDIFARASERELELRSGSSSASYKSIIRPRCLEDSLQSVSEKRVEDLREEFKEYQVFLDQVKDTVQRSPVEEKKMCEALEKAGFDNPMEEIANLIDIGILRKYQRRLSDPIRYHFPDIYLKGLGLQRAGMH